MKFKFGFAGLVAVALLIIFAAPQQAQEKSSLRSGILSKRDHKFAKKATLEGLLQVQAGQLAVSKGGAPVVRQFGEVMVTLHSQANEELKRLATVKEASLPAKLGKERKRLEGLRTLSGAEFDRAYAKLMVMEYQEALREYQDFAKKAEDPDLKEFAARAIPTVEQHLAEAKKLAP